MVSMMTCREQLPVRRPPDGLQDARCACWNSAQALEYVSPRFLRFPKCNTSQSAKRLEVDLSLAPPSGGSDGMFDQICFKSKNTEILIVRVLATNDKKPSSDQI